MRWRGVIKSPSKESQQTERRSQPRSFDTNTTREKDTVEA